MVALDGAIVFVSRVRERERVGKEGRLLGKVMHERLSKAAVNDGQVLDRETPYQVFSIRKHHTESSLLIDRIPPRHNFEQTSNKQLVLSIWLSDQPT
jgi:hypothetical protein